MSEVLFDWGRNGVRHLAPRCAALVVVDVLSFSTAVDIATTAAARVLPLPMSGPDAAAAAQDAGAVLAGPRSRESWSLSPSSLRSVPAGLLLALPSPNGATLCAEAAELGVAVLVGCLRNAGALAAAAAAAAGAGQVGVIAAGERWGVVSGPLRPAVEDLLGAGAIISALPGARSPEAEVAAAAHAAVADRLEPLLLDCESGAELRELGFADDVRLAAEADVSGAAPALRAGALEA
ncbi:2-phosphosulfolactate phosphatase [Saccharopolyspora sp. MS10]|uniref:2-phosphosulfolactate phosphatase n=1 Tax=Saccharopolyspora sp. MS10 TaxID=3385973 RepID=UPI0039A07831